MRTSIAAVLAGALILSTTPAAHATLVVGGNGKADCYVGLDVVADGEIVKTTPSAITANACNGTCTFTVKACVGLSEPTKCTATALSSLTTTQSVPVPTLGPVTGNVCGAEHVVTVTLPGKKKKAKSKIKLVATAESAKPKKDTDNIKLICKASTTPCVAATTTTTTTPLPTTTTLPPMCGDMPCATTTTTTLIPVCGATCSNNFATGPDELVLKIAESGTDLDNGWKGASHNFPLVPNGILAMCLSNCDGTTDTTCDVCGKVGAGTKNGAVFGAPLPLLASGTAVCVVSKWRKDISGTTDVATGASSLVVGLNSEVSLTTQDAVCPQCVGGRCKGGARDNQGCTEEATLPVFISQTRTDQYHLSSECLPSSKVATLQIDFNPLTSGTSAPLTGDLPCPRAPGTPGVNPLKDACGGGTCAAGNCTGLACVTHAEDPTNPGQMVCIDSKGGLSQACCDNSTSTPCFLRDANNQITRTGKPNAPTPAGDTYPKTMTGVLASTFCIPATGTSTIDSVTGLPGPGTILLNGNGTWTRQ